MSYLTNAQIIYKHHNSVTTLFGLWREDSGLSNRPADQTVCNKVQKIRKTWSVGDSVSRIHWHSMRLGENITAVWASVGEDLNFSVRQRQHSLSPPYGSLHCILHEGYTYTRVEFNQFENWSPENMDRDEYTQNGKNFFLMKHISY